VASINDWNKKIINRYGCNKKELWCLAKESFRRDRFLEGKRGIGNTGFHREGKSRARQALKGCCNG
jgi:hypothetical protein